MTRPAPPPRLLPILLLVSVSATLLAAFAGVGWLRSARAPVLLDELPASDRQRLVSEIQKVLPGSFRAGSGQISQWPGAGDFTDGTMGRAATVLVRPAAGTRRLRVRLARLERVRGFYPIDVVVSIPGPDGEALRDGRVLDVVVEAGAVTAIADTEVAGSLRIVAVEAAD